MHTQKIHSHAYCSCGQRHRSGYDRLLLSDLAEIIVRELEKHRQRSTAKVCQSAVNSLHRFTGNENLPLKDISPDLMQRYEDYLANENLKRNTISCYMRNLRALLNKATSRKLIPPPPENPFVQVYTGTCHTRKRALSKDEICRLSALGSENALSSALYRTQQYFLFGFHACGMSFIDLAFLRKSDLSDGHISYRRIKTGLLIPVKITRPMQEIIDYFAPAVSHSPYAFPIIDPAKGNERLQYETALRNQNRRLKTLCRLAGIEKNISTHVARHSWATVAKKENIVTTVISDCLGHRDEKTTAIYLDSFDITVTDMASELVSAVISGTDIPREAGRMLFRNENMPDYRAYKKRKVPSKKCPFLHK